MNDLDPGNDYSDAELSKKIPSDVYGFQNGQLTDHETFPNPTITQKLGALLDIRKNDKCSFCMLVADTFLPLFLEEIEEGYPLWELYQPEKEIWLSLYYDIRGDSFDLDNFELHGLHTHKYPSLRYPRGKIRAILSIKDNAWTKRHELLSDARAEIVPMRDVLELEDAGSGARSWNPIGIDTELPEEWLKICERDHGARCAAPKMFDGLPIYEELLLLDVRRGCLVKGFQGRRYFALSYVWYLTISRTACYID